MSLTKSIIKTGINRIEVNSLSNWNKKGLQIQEGFPAALFKVHTGIPLFQLFNYYFYFFFSHSLAIIFFYFFLFLFLILFSFLKKKII